MKWWKENETTAVIKFFGEIYQWWNGAKDFTDTFDQLQREFKTVEIKVHCYGGSVIEGNVIQHAIANATCEVIVDYVGVAASMGGLAFLPAKKIRMAENAFVMIHEPYGATSGNYKQMFEYANLLKKMTTNATKAYAKRSGKPVSEFQKYMDGADHWLSADECLAVGLVDEIIPSVVSDVKDISKSDLTAEDKFKGVFDLFAANLSDKNAIPNSNIKTTEMKELLITMFGLTALSKDSSDSAVAEALKAKFDTLNSSIKALNKSGVAFAIAASEKVNGKEFSPEQKANLLKIGEDIGIDALNIVLSFSQPAAPAAAAPAAAPAAVPGSAAPAAPAIVNLITNEVKTTGAAGDPAKATWKYSEWLQKDNAGLMEMRVKETAQYIKLYKDEYGFEPDLS